MAGWIKTVKDKLGLKSADPNDPEIQRKNSTNAEVGASILKKSNQQLQSAMDASGVTAEFGPPPVRQVKDKKK
jgi:hypothetical protein